MDVREKLVELLNEVQEAGVNEIPAGFGFTREYIANEKVASHLTATGVTVQEWISVDDRLPKNSDNVLVCHNNGLVTTNAWLGSNWWFNNERNQITHWMPLPEPLEVGRND